MNCCAECFGDRGLRRSIIPARSVDTGDCAYCGSTDLAVLHPTLLAEYFQLLVTAYRPETGGRLLVQWFRDDWGLFEHPEMDEPRAKDLLAEVRKWMQEHRRLKALIHEVSQLTLALIKGHVPDRKRRRGRP